MNFKAEVKKVESKKQSLDMIYKITLETDNPMILDLGKLPSDTIVDVEIGLENAST